MLAPFIEVDPAGRLGCALLCVTRNSQCRVELSSLRYAVYGKFARTSSLLRQDRLAALNGVATEAEVLLDP